MKKRIYLLSLFLAFSVIFVSCKKDDNVKKKDEVENNGNNGNNGGNNNGGNNNGNNNGGNNGGTNNAGSAENNTILAHSEDNTEGQLTKAHASVFAGNTVAVFVNGKYNQRNLDVRLILGPGELPKTDRSYDLQGILFTAQNEKAYISVQNGTGSENTWYTASKLGGQLYAKVEADGSIIFSFENVTFEVSKPPYNETKVFSGKFTLPADFATSSASKPVVYDLAD